MEDEELNRLINGPLNHPLISLQLMRLMLALRSVVDATGPAGAQALRDHCVRRQARDDSYEEEFGPPPVDYSRLAAQIGAEESSSLTVKERVRDARERLPWEDS